MNSSIELRRTPEQAGALLLSFIKQRVLGGAGSGNFGHEGRPGEVGGSGPGGAGEKTKHTPEQIKQALQMKADGKTYKQITAATGLKHGTLNYYVKKQNAAEEMIGGKLFTPGGGDKPSIQGQKISGPVFTEEAGTPAASAGSKFDQSSISATPTTAPSSAGDKAALAEKYGYDWKEKTFGPNAGKYAWFQNNVQVSAPFAKDQAESAAAGMHYGTGPKAPAAPFTDAHATDWPIGNSVPRSIGTKYPAEVASKYNGWASSLPSAEYQSVHDYTGNEYSDINHAMRKGELNSYAGKQGLRIQSALSKAPTPPPPELVWRGLNGGAAKALANEDIGVGGVIRLKGFQSTSINPDFAAGWHHGGQEVPLLEIKPKVGAYVQPISSHKNEREFLLPHDAKYVVKGIAHVKFKGHGTVKVMQLEMQ